MSTQPLPIDQFAQKVRDKYPGSYDHLSDGDLVSKITAKYPQYKANVDQNIPDATAQAHAVAAKPLSTSLPDTVTPKDGESFGDTMQRGVDVGKSILADPDKLRMANVHGEGEGIADAPLVLGAASIPAIAAAPGAAAAGMAGSYLAGKGLRAAGSAFNASPATQENLEGAGNFVGGLAGGMFGPKAINAGRSALSSSVSENGAYKPSVQAVGAALKHPTEIPGRIATAIGKKIVPPAPYDTGASLPSADEFYENRGEELMERGKQQSALDRQDRLSRSPTQQANGYPVSRIPNRMPSQSVGSPITAPEGSETGAEPSRRAPLTESEGRPATWTNEKVKELASWGDPDAIEQARNRGFGRIPQRFSATQLNPREVVKFDENGAPVNEGRQSIGTPIAEEFEQHTPEDMAGRSSFVRTPEAPAGAGRGPAPMEMHPEELTEIRKLTGRPNLTPEEAHAYRIAQTARAAAARKPNGDLGGFKRAGQ